MTSRYNAIEGLGRDNGRVIPTPNLTPTQVCGAGLNSRTAHCERLKMQIFQGRLLLAVATVGLFIGAAGCGADSSNEHFLSSDTTTEDLETFQPTDEEVSQTSQSLSGGCSNAQIRGAQSFCRNAYCPPKRSRGIHYCKKTSYGSTFSCDCY